MGCFFTGRCLKEEKEDLWSSPIRVLAFNVDGAARGKPGLAGIGSVLRNHKKDVLHVFSKHVGIRGSSEAEVLAILEALPIFNTSYQHHLIVETDSFNVISWVNSSSDPWKKLLYFHHLASLSQTHF